MPPDDLEHRLERLEDRFDQYMTVFYRWLDELRADHELSKQKIVQNEQAFARSEQRIYLSEQRIEQNEKSIEELLAANAQSLRIQNTQTELMTKMMDMIFRVDTKVDSLLNRGSNGKH